MNIYGESPWSMEIPVQTIESIVNSDGMINSMHWNFRFGFFFVLDLPQLHVVSYNSKENYLHFDYLPDDDRLRKLTNEQICLNIRQSTDGNLYQPIEQCLLIFNNRVQWVIKKEYPYLKLSICSKKNRNICGPEIEMKEGFIRLPNSFYFYWRNILFHRYK
jgi:hypothetical protein